MSSYADFELTINPKDAENSFVVHGRTAKGMQDSDSLILPVDDPRYQAFQTALDYNTPLTEDQVVDFGIVLYETLLKGKIWALFTTARETARSQGQSLRIKLNIDANNPALATVATIPWEFACDSAGIPLTTDHSICRFLTFPESVPVLSLGQEKLRIALVGALPAEMATTHPVDIQGELAAIHRSLEPLVTQNQVEIIEETQLTAPKLQRLVREWRPHIVHYVGHGDFQGTTGALILDDGNGKKHLSTARTLATLLRNSSVRLVVLNACKTSTVSSTALLRGIAPALMAANIPAVVAMQSSILDTAGKAFAEEFYRVLATGTPIDACVAEGRKAIIAYNFGQLDWGLATLYMRADDGVLFNLPNPPAPSNQVVTPTTAPTNETAPPATPTSGNSINNFMGSGNTFSGGNFSFGNVVAGNHNQTTINHGSSQPNTPSSANDKQQALAAERELLALKEKNLHNTKMQIAKYGIGVPVHLLNQQDDLRQDIAEIQKRITELSQ
ncbi:CHAT domain-containing protein [Herpetosiphon gulosus]|uniref:CHAT domain-containing protein n=1 Tax=Herpetosiphon gulosus TaxID=1973496 RepID=A0ABP9X1C6_9CHLR